MSVNLKEPLSWAQAYDLVMVRRDITHAGEPITDELFEKI